MGKNVTFEGDSVSKQVQSYYSKNLSKLAANYDTDITLFNCHGRWDIVPKELNFDTFYIYVQLLPKVCEGIKKDKIDGYTIGGKELKFIKKEGTTDSQSCPQGDTLSYAKLGDGCHPIVDEKGKTMAVVYDGALYFLNDFIHCRNKEELEISSTIFDYVMNYAVNKTDVLRYLKAGVEEKSKRALEAALKSQFTTRLDKEIIQLKAAKDTITQYEKGITEAVRKVTATEKIVEAIKTNMNDIPSALQKTWIEIDKMKNTDTYTTISFMRTGIKAITTPIIINYNKKKYKMGRYEVLLGFDGSTKIHALEKPENCGGTDHPHVSSGNVCWGNFSGYIPKLIGSSQFDVALTQIYTFLCHYDAASPYRKLEDWPLVEEKKEKETK